MKVILLKDVGGVGRQYDIKEVAPGYARNFLIARGFAEPAMGSALARLEHLKEKLAAEKKVQEEKLMVAVGEIEGATITLKENANESGHLFAGINAQKILQVLKEQKGINLSVEHIHLEKPIKTLGTFEIPVAVGNKKATLTVVVEKSA